MSTDIAHAEASPPELGTRTAAALAPEPGVQSSPVLARMLRMADRYRSESHTRQAAEMYFELLERHGDAPETVRVRERLLEIAQEYENSGECHQARGIYERLL